MQECPKTDAATDHEECGSTEKYLFAPAFNGGATGFGCLLELLQWLRVSNLIVVEVNDVYLDAMLHLHLPQLVQMVPPLRVLLQVVRDTLGKQNVAGIATIHHALRDIDPGTGDIRSLIDIRYFVDRPAMNAHPHAQ